MGYLIQDRFYSDSELLTYNYLGDDEQGKPIESKELAIKTMNETAKRRFKNADADNTAVLLENGTELRLDYQDIVYGHVVR